MYYKIFSTEKCVCFIFLVILLILNCYAYRIDNLATSDINNRKSSIVHTSFPISPHNFPSSSTNPYTERIFKMPQLNKDENSPQHKIRHRHRLMMHLKESRNTADTFSPTLFFLNNITTPLDMALPIRTPNSNNIQKRSFLKNVDSPKKRSNSNNNRRSWKAKQNEDITWRAYKAEIVVHAEILGQSNNTSDSSWLFRVVESYKRHCKGQFVLDVDLGTVQEPNNRNWLMNQQQRKYRHPHNNQKFEQVVDNKIGQHYLLFLNSTTSSLFTRFKSVSNPKIIKLGRFNDANIKKVCSRDFHPKPAKILKLKKHIRDNRVIIRCKVKGLPIPKISWRHRNRTLHRTEGPFRIQYRSQDGKDWRESKLVIENVNEATAGRYECIAIGVNNRVEHNITVKAPPKIDIREMPRTHTNNRTIHCHAHGSQIARIRWKKDGVMLKEDFFHHIEQIGRSDSKLTIDDAKVRNSTKYECWAWAKGRNGMKGHQAITLSPVSTPPPGQLCDDSKKDFCSNGGICRYEESLNEMYCECPPGFDGRQCEAKVPSDASIRKTWE